MTVRSLIAGLMGVILIVGLSGCYPEFENPLSTSEDSIHDKRLTGLWAGHPEDEPDDKIYLAFFPRENNQTDIMMMGFEDGDESWFLMSSWITEISGQHYMSIKFVNEDGEAIESQEDNYVLCRYVIDEAGRLTVSDITVEGITREIEDGLLGEVQEGKWSDRAVVTASTPQLIEWIKTVNPDEIFNSEIGVYERVK